MKKNQKLFLTTFLKTGPLFGVITAIWDYFDYGTIDFIKILFLSLFFGLLMGWTSVRNFKKSSVQNNKN